MKKNTIYISIGVGILVCIIIVVVVYFVMKDKPKTEKLEGASTQTPPSSFQKTETPQGAEITTTQIPPSSLQQTTKDSWQLRYLKVSRTTASIIDIVSIEAWYNKTRIYAVNVSGSPMLNGIHYPYENANDNNYGSFAHTLVSKDAFILLDFGQDIHTNKVRIVFRNNAVERDTNIVLTATDHQGREVFQVTHTKYCIEMSLLYPDTSIIVSNTISDWN